MASAWLRSWVPYSTASRGCQMHRSAMRDARCGRWRYSRHDDCASGLLQDDGIILARCPSMSMISDRVLRPTELRALSGRSDAQGAQRLAIHVALLAGTGWLVAISGPATLVPAMLVFGL